MNHKFGELERLGSMLKLTVIYNNLAHDPFQQRERYTELLNSQKIMKSILNTKAF